MREDTLYTASGFPHGQKMYNGIQKAKFIRDVVKTPQTEFSQYAESHEVPLLSNIFEKSSEKRLLGFRKTHFSKPCTYFCVEKA